MLLNFIMKKKKDLIQLSKNEYYNSNEYIIKNSKKVNYEGNKDAKRQYYVQNKMLGRARDPRANGAWLNKLTMKHEVFVLGGQRIDQKSKKGWKRG